MTATREIIERANSIPWFHSIDLGGYVTRGVKTVSDLEREQRAIFDPINLRDSDVIDIGAWAGAHSFAAKRRGAKRVLATDHYTWTHSVFRGREAFDIANAANGSSIEALEIDVPDISVKSVGTWDVVLFLGVLYHLKSPLTALEAIAEVASDCLIVETRVQNVNRRSPMLVYHPSDTLSGDTTNYFTPNPAFLLSVLRECGFSVFDTLVFHERLTLHGWRNTSRRKLGTAPEMHKGAVVYPAYRAAQAVKRLLTRRGR